MSTAHSRRAVRGRCRLVVDLPFLLFTMSLGPFLRQDELSYRFTNASWRISGQLRPSAAKAVTDGQTHRRHKSVDMRKLYQELSYRQYGARLLGQSRSRHSRKPIVDAYNVDFHGTTTFWCFSLKPVVERYEPNHKEKRDVMVLCLN